MSNEYLDCYVRVSSNIQRDEGNSLVVQEEMGKKVSKILGLKFRLHQEGSRSSTTQYRDVLGELQYKIMKGEVKNLWTQDKSRLFRDMTDGLLFRRDFLEKYRITLYEGSTPTVLNLDSPEENLQYNILMTFNQYENEQRSRKSKTGKRWKLEYESSNKPVFNGGTPLFGYKNKDKLWVVSKEDSKWVKVIFDTYEKGKSIRDIKGLLDREGVEPRRTGNGLWNTRTLWTMLMNKTYTGLHTIQEWEDCGEQEYLKGIVKTPELFKKTKKRNIWGYKKSIKTHSYKVPKIINVGQFNRVQKLLDKNKTYKDNNKKHFSLLEQFLVCECGKRMGSRHLKTTSSLGYKVNTRSYYCLSSLDDWKSGNDKVCMNRKSLQMDSLNDYVVGFVKDRVSKSNILKDKFKKEVLEDKFQKMKDIQKTEKDLETKLQRIQREIDHIEDQVVEMEISKGLGKKDKNIVSKVIKRFGEELENRKVYYEEIEKEIDDLGKDKNWLNWVEKYGETIELNTSNEEIQQDFLQGILKQIIIISEYEKNRDGKEVQKGHSLDFRFNLNIVEDEYQVIDESTKPRTYKVIEGKDREKGETMKFVSPRNRTKKKRV